MRNIWEFRVVILNGIDNDIIMRFLGCVILGAESGEMYVENRVCGNASMDENVLSSNENALSLNGAFL